MRKNSRTPIFTYTEKRSIYSLSGILFFRMFSIFLLLPVFSVLALDLKEATPFLIGVAFGAYGNEQLPDDSVFKFIDERIEAQKKSLNELEKDDPLTTRMIGAVGQDAAFVMPIYKKMKSAGIP